MPSWKRVSALFAARTIESHVPELNSNLLTLVDLQRAERPASASVLQTIEKRAAVTLSHVDVDQAVDRRPLLHVSYALLATVALLCLYTVVSPKKVMPSVWRALVPTADVSVATKTEIYAIQPGNIDVLRGSQLEVTADIRGTVPEAVHLLFTTADRRSVDESLEMRETEEGLRQYHVLLTGDNGRGLHQDLTYHIVAGDARTPDFHVRVIQPPSANVEYVHYEFPAYMELKPKTQPGGAIDVWEGAAVTITAKANMPLKSARIVFSDTEDRSGKAEELRMQVTDGTSLQAEWRAAFRPDGTYPRYYHIQCENERGDVDPEPTVYPISVRPDQPPEVAVLDPKGDLKRPANAVVPLMIEARDPDFLLRYLTLRLEKNGEELNVVRQIFDGSRKSVRLTYDLDLKPLGLKSGDLLTYWIEARDNKRPIGNRKNTPKLNIEITEPASEEKVQEELQKDRERQQEMTQEQQRGDAQSGEESQGGEQAADESQARSQEKQDGQEGQDTNEKPNEAESEPSTDDAQKSDSDGNEQKQPQPAGGDGEEGEAKQPKLRNDGSDDDEALRRLMQYQKEDSQDAKKQPSQPSDDEGAAKDGQQDKAGESKSRSQESGSGNASEKSNPTDQPDRSDSSEGSAEQQPGEGTTDTTKAQDTGNKPDSQSDSPANGDEMPADDSPDAQREKATGEETGTGTPDESPDSNPTPATNDVERKPGTDPQTQRGTSDGECKGTQDSQGSDNGGATGGQRSDRSSERGSDSPKSSDGQPNGSSSDSPAKLSGDSGKQESSDSPSKDGQQPGQSQTKDETGKPPDSGSDKGSGQDSQSGEQGKSGDSDSGKGQSGQEQSGKGKSGQGKSGQGQGGQGQSGQGQPGQGGQSSPGQSVGGGGELGMGTGQEGAGQGADGAGDAKPEAANVEFTRQAADLVLKRIEDDLERGQVDEELLKELGWTQEDMRRFSERLKQQLQTPDTEDSPESIARRRQFEEMLRNLNLQTKETHRHESGADNRLIDDINSRRLPVPAEYRELYEAFTRSMSKKSAER